MFRFQLNPLYLYFLLVLSSVFQVRAVPTTRIVGGENAFAGQFAFAAAIHVYTEDSRFFCGGTLSANQWVITAGHCVNNAILFTIQLGSNELESNDPNRVTVSTSDYVLHPDFDPETIQNDIGLIKLRLPIQYTVYIHMIHPIPDGTPWNTQNVYVLGWGQTTDAESGLVNDLRYAIISFLENSECRQFYGNQITENMICVIGNYNEGTCTGDNGGALAVQNGRTYSLVGVSSFISAEGCESTHPSGYTRTTPYFDWIVNYTKLEDF